MTFVWVYFSAKNLTGTKFYTGTVVSPSAPRTEQGLYWGYTVRLAPSFGAVFTQSPYKDGYDVTIGTSERGTMVDDLVLPNFRYIYCTSLICKKVIFNQTWLYVQ